MNERGGSAEVGDVHGYDFYEVDIRGFNEEMDDI